MIQKTGYAAVLPPQRRDRRPVAAAHFGYVPKLHDIILGPQRTPYPTKLVLPRIRAAVVGAVMQPVLMFERATRDATSVQQERINHFAQQVALTDIALAALLGALLGYKWARAEYLGVSQVRHKHASPNVKLAVLAFAAGCVGSSLSLAIGLVAYRHDRPQPLAPYLVSAAGMLPVGLMICRSVAGSFSPRYKDVESLLHRKRR